MMSDEHPQLPQPPDELSDDQLEQVTGGEGNDPAQMFQQIMQQLTQGSQAGIQKDGSTDLDAGKK